MKDNGLLLLLRVLRQWYNSVQLTVVIKSILGSDIRELCVSEAMSSKTQDSISNHERALLVIRITLRKLPASCCPVGRKSKERESAAKAPDSRRTALIWRKESFSIHNPCSVSFLVHLLESRQQLLGSFSSHTSDHSACVARSYSNQQAPPQRQSRLAFSYLQ